MTYFLKIFRTGAIRKTPKRVINKVVASVKKDKYISIVEFGSGQGEITSEIVKRNVPTTILNYYAIELDPILSEKLKDAFPKINVVNNNALFIEKYLSKDKKVDYFISSIPLSFYSKKEINIFVELLMKRLENNGKIIFVLNALWLIPLLRKLLPESRIEFFFTFPIYFTIIYSKQLPKLH